jgi:dsDNA-specific endonuclease/ATPase MutS2
MTNYNYFSLETTVKQDKLYSIIENSPFLPEFMINMLKPLNPNLEGVFGKVQGISNVLEMLVFGEEAVKIRILKLLNIEKELNYQDAIKLAAKIKDESYANHIYNAIGTLENLRESIEAIATGDKYSPDLALTIQKQAKLWSEIIGHL